MFISLTFSAVGRSVVCDFSISSVYSIVFLLILNIMWNSQTKCCFQMTDKPYEIHAYCKCRNFHRRGYIKFCKIINLPKWQNNSAIYCELCVSHKFLTLRICLIMIFVKLKVL